MQKLGRFNYTIEYKRGISNLAADTLIQRPDHIRTKAKLVDFADQYGQPLTSVQTFLQDSAVTCNFVCTVRPKHSTIRIPIGNNTSTTMDHNLVQIGIKGNDSLLLNQYLQQLKLPLTLDDYLKKWVVDVS